MSSTVTVTIEQPTTTSFIPPGIPPSHYYSTPTDLLDTTSEWKSNICDICSDGYGVCMHIWCCSCIAIGQNADLVDFDYTCCMTSTLFAILQIPILMPSLLFGIPICFSPTVCIHFPIRRKLRAKYGINESFTGEDLLFTCCLPLCALCQEVHEILERGDARM
jgi:Cys-rich protein (TIGR01571 family)